MVRAGQGQFGWGRGDGNFFYDTLAGRSRGDLGCFYV